MTDIPSLIERIDKELDGVVYPDRRGQMLREAREALSLAVSPLPGETADEPLLAEIIAHFAENDWRPGDDWAFPDDNSSLCLDHRLPDNTAFWLDIEKDGVVILWRRPGEEARTLHLKAAAAL